MACSKIFSGDIPEISTCIIQNFRNNFNTLYSLALLNRFWCQLAIPLLWEDPFYIKYRESTPHFLHTYFLFLNDDVKILVKEIKEEEFILLNLQKSPLFNYPSLIKTLNVSRLKTHVEKWLGYFGYYSPDLDEPHHFSLICPQYYDRENYGYYD